MHRTLPLLITFVAFAALTGCAARAVVSVDALQPAIVPVEAWGGSRVNVGATRTHEIKHITLHHGGVDFHQGSDAPHYLRNLQMWSRNTRGWPDIPYHYLIDPDGKIYEGRDITLAGDTNTEYDPVGHALVVVLGDFDKIDPNAAQLDATVNVMAMLAKRYNVAPTTIQSHRDYAKTSCPGAKLYPYIATGELARRVAAKL
ncbi:MAG: N-acetylmuramoyl-L-alanine amidase [Burkholderiales bacterium]|nr:N-acetylmuramoyl-L-alanine amidase [Burkholderiales bacterium]